MVETHSIAPLAEFDPKRPVSKIVHNSAHLRVVLFCLDSGQSIPAHTSPSTVTFHTLAGKGEVLVGNEVVPVEAGQLTVAPPNVPHGLTARQRLTVLATIAPSPE